MTVDVQSVQKFGRVIILLALGTTSPLLSAETFTGQVVRVSDGDTVKVLTEQTCNSGGDCRSGKVQYRVRLAEIDAPEKKQPFGSKAKAALSALVAGQMITVEQVGKDGYGRLVANLYADGKWVNAELVRSGDAWVYRQYAKTPRYSNSKKRQGKESAASGHCLNRRELPPGNGARRTNHNPFRDQDGAITTMKH
ncbi:thermonuclease family protein [Aeromonas caviae]|uniref:thermonuclease family protein n=1 Tax=Aeromonas caviae TaxID=648 RepID=UPI003EC59E48